MMLYNLYASNKDSMGIRKIKPLMKDVFLFEIERFFDGIVIDSVSGTAEKCEYDAFLGDAKLTIESTGREMAAFKIRAISEGEVVFNDFVNRQSLPTLMELIAEKYPDNNISVKVY